MKQYWMAASMLLVMASGAAAADLGSKAPAVVAPGASPIATWTGLYLGVTAGAGSAAVDHADAYLDFQGKSSVKVMSWMAGGTVGYNWQVKSFVLGAEADLSYSGFDKKSTMYYGGVLLQSKMNWFATTRLRAGVTLDNVLIYATGGAVLANVEHTSEWNTFAYCGKTKSYVSCVDKSQLGATFGGGIEAMLFSNVSFKAEYLRLDLPTITTTGKDGFKQTWSDSADIIRAGVNYRF
ncbi:hypothetical protein C2U72_01330 [Prosthecomicrobium hirschii]|uniref:outer membrane protein n=1 Tax=Prosthecodimorpha hirschii TaxID=665126 RepID=UPI00112BAD4D|nr:outer membrane beta-barrel protein [Prosthecomicrobium hirschii]TPQ52793.1 hypothetical protein C2U72_01330 [Prosthecomicrobium hirschii]